jgi:transposase
MEQLVVLRTREMQLLEAEHGRPMDELLRSLYVDEGLGVEEIANRLRLTKGTVSRWMARFGIPARRHRDRKVAV